MNKAPMFIAAFVLSAFAVAGVGLVAVTQSVTAERIAGNERDALMSKLQALVPDATIENDPLAERAVVSAPDLLGGESTQVYRVRSGGELVAVILDPTVPNGYAGPIKLLVSVLADHSLGGVRVLAHHETPGLGDKIEERKSDWILSFNGRSLGNPPPERWAVKRDGGIFDQFTGATITPRSIVRAVKGTLQFVERESDELFPDADAEGLETATPASGKAATAGVETGRETS